MAPTDVLLTSGSRLSPRVVEHSPPTLKVTLPHLKTQRVFVSKTSFSSVSNVARLKPSVSVALVNRCIPRPCPAKVGNQKRATVKLAVVSKFSWLP